MKDHHVVQTKRHVHLQRRDGWMDTKRRILRNKVTIARRRRRKSKRHVEEKQEKKGRGIRGGGGEVRELTVRLGSMRFFFYKPRQRDEGSFNRPMEKEGANKNEGNERGLRVA
ncbi:hypothetical protein ACS0PU_000354 [Formica fusca]